MKYILLLSIAVCLFVTTAATAPTAEEHFRVGMENLKNQKLVEAIGNFTEALSLKPAYADAYYQRGKAKEMLAIQKGYMDNERYTDLLEAVRLGKKEALREIKEGYAGECIAGLNYTLQNDQIYCLDMSSANLKRIPEQLSKMNNLIQLTVGDNQLKDINTILVNNPMLLSLDARRNQIESLSADIKNLQYLQELNLRDNAITTLPAETSQLKHLQILNLTGNPIADSEKDRIREMLPHCRVYFSSSEQIAKSSGSAKFRPARKATEIQANKKAPKRF